MDLDSLGFFLFVGRQLSSRFSSPYVWGIFGVNLNILGALSLDCSASLAIASKMPSNLQLIAWMGYWNREVCVGNCWFGIWLIQFVCDIVWLAGLLDLWFAGCRIVWYLWVNSLFVVAREFLHRTTGLRLWNLLGGTGGKVAFEGWMADNEGVLSQLLPMIEGWNLARVGGLVIGSGGDLVMRIGPVVKRGDLDMLFEFVLVGDLGRFEGVVGRVWDVGLEVAHNQWLIDGLMNLMGETVDLSEIARFIDEHLDMINRLRGGFVGSPRYLGRGSDGVAWDIGGGRVLKLFLNQFAWQSAVDAMERLHSGHELAGAEAMLHDVGVLGQFGRHTIYWYVMELMQPVESELGGLGSVRVQRLIDLVRGLLRGVDVLEMWGSPKFVGRLRQVVGDIVGNLRATQSELLSQIELNFPQLQGDWLSEFVREIAVKLATGRRDLSVGNLGISGKRVLRFFDPAIRL